ncbi:MAG: protein kinase [Catenulispora sp.]|nr:protein kinase [Catenulispora sp.]
MKELLPGDPERLGPYEIRSRIGTGGMGVVYLGRSPSGRLAAVKLVRAEVAGDEEFRARFRREIDAARQVSGAFTAAVLDADPDAAQPWLATAYVEGPSLRERVADAGPLPLTEARRLGSGLAEALTDLHRVGLVHRDVKPGNVLLAADGPRLIDFGIIRSDTLADLTDTGYVLGSAGYMAPEQAAGEHTGPAADVFALGAVLTFALTGRGPFGVGSAATLLLRTVNSDPDVSGVPDELRGVIQRCLAPDPVDRPRDRDLIAMLAPDAEPLPEWERPPRADPAPRPAMTRQPPQNSQNTGNTGNTGNTMPRPAPIPLARYGPGREAARLHPSTPAAPYPRATNTWAGSNPPRIAGPSRRALLGWTSLVGVVGIGIGARDCGGPHADTNAWGAPSSSYANPYTYLAPSSSDPTAGRPAAGPPQMLWHTTAVQGAALDSLGSAVALSQTDTTLYAVTKDGLAGLDRKDGSGRWAVTDAAVKPGTGTGHHAPLAEKDAIYLLSGSTVVALTPAAPPAVVWHTDAAGLSGPRLLGRAGASLVLYQSSDDGTSPQRVLVLDTVKRTVQWTLGLGPRDGVALTDDGLLIRAAAADKKVCAYLPADGRLVWSSSYPDPPIGFATVIAAGGRVYVDGSTIAVFDAKTGTDTATTSYGSYVLVAADSQTAYALDSSVGSATLFVAFEPGGTDRWRKSFENWQPGKDCAYLATPKALIVASPETHRVTALNAADGTVLWEWEEQLQNAWPAEAGYSLAADAGFLYVGASSGIYCFSISG